MGSVGKGTKAMEPERRQNYRRQEDRKLLLRDRQLDAAQRLCQEFFQHYCLEKLIEKVLSTALDVAGAEAGSVLLADPDTRQLVFRYVRGERAEILHGKAFPWDQGIAGAVFKSGKAEVIRDVKKDSRHFPDVDRLTHYQTHDMITLPLKKWEGEPIGVLNILNKRDGELNEDDLAVLTIISTFAAVAIQQARLFEEAKKAEVVGLLGDIGHDLKNLLQPLVTGTEMLKEEVDEVFGRLPGKQESAAIENQRICRDVVDMVQSTSRRIQDRVRQIADCVKGLGTPPLYKPCHVQAVVDGVFKTLRVFAEGKGIVLRTEGLDSLPPIMADEQRLFNAFYNLVNNAIPEVSRGGSITIHGCVDSQAPLLVLSVSDTGRGMPPDIRDRLFTAHAISRKPGGTGLGTKIVKDVVDSHRGHITVESQEGRGTTFTIRLPMDPTKQEPRLG